MQALAEILCNSKVCSAVARQAAGLQLKILLTSKEEKLKRKYQKRWVSLPISTRTCIKDSLLGSLGTEVNHPRCVAQCLAYITAAELNPDEYAHSTTHYLVNDILSSLNGLLEQSNSAEAVREAAIETVGLICQEAVKHFKLLAINLLLNQLFYI